MTSKLILVTLAASTRPENRRARPLAGLAALLWQVGRQAGEHRGALVPAVLHRALEVGARLLGVVTEEPRREQLAEAQRDLQLGVVGVTLLGSR